MAFGLLGGGGEGVVYVTSFLFVLFWIFFFFGLLVGLFGCVCLLALLSCISLICSEYYSGFILRAIDKIIHQPEIIELYTHFSLAFIADYFMHNMDVDIFASVLQRDRMKFLIGTHSAF
jgi:hypothetical protein